MYHRCVLTLFVFSCVIEGRSDTAIQVGGYINLTVKNSHILGGRLYGVRCSGRRVDCHVTNSRLQAISCYSVRSCTIQYSTVLSTRPHAQAINAVSVRTLIIDSNVIANTTSGQAARASGCNSVQASCLFPF